MEINVKRSMANSQRQRLAHTIGALGAALAYMVLLHRVSSIPGKVESPGAVEFVYLTLTPTMQNLLHIPAFAVLAVLFSHALPKTAGWAVATLLITAGYGAYDEWFQLGVPGRYGSLTDWVLDLLGALFGVALYRYLSARTQKSCG
uniref:VanZ family protein n=1 Tax=Marinobacterium profundum TaxID=1714300 RepID=UPI00083650EE|nr:VanZ family protein [Marinobacterium profundum]